MRYNNITPQIDTLRYAAPVAAGTDGARVALPEIDMSRYPAGVRLIAIVGAVASGGVLTLRAKGTDTTTVYGSGTVDDVQMRDANLNLVPMTVAATNAQNKVVILEITKPLRRFLRFEYQRTVANVTIEGFLIEGIENDRPVNPEFDRVELVAGYAVA